MHWKPSPRAPSLCPAAVPPTPSAKCQVPAPVAFVTDGNCPQPLWQPPPTACPTATGAASEAPSLLMHPWGAGKGVLQRGCLPPLA